MAFPTHSQVNPDSPNPEPCYAETAMEMFSSGLPRIPINLAYLPRATSGGELILEVQDKKPVQPTHEMELKSLGYRNPEYNPYDSDPDFNPWDSAGIWWVSHGCRSNPKSNPNT
eukprot:624682-Prorocentrum_minimum.AAC.2